MRAAFASTLFAAAERDPRIWLLTGDVGYSVLEPFQMKFPDRFVNAGVAEQNMLGVAAGLALAGRKVFVYSLANFPTLRCLEQLRNDVAYHRLDVTIVAVGGGLSYGGHGYSHHAVEDIGIVRLLPNISVFAPGDEYETAWATAELAKRSGPGYLRLGRGDEPAVHGGIGPNWQVGQPILLRSGPGAVLACTGATLALSLRAAEQLDATLFSVPTLEPLDPTAILDAARSAGRIVSIEDHAGGGLGTIIAETLALVPHGIELRPVRFGREPVEVAGSPAYLSGLHGVNLEGIVRAATGR
ncbi:MAG: hypothetical protein K1X57_01385 [Gemmataceae bacterium]|nr:hypothetical protein [Gemmataceae bacterium]